MCTINHTATTWVTVLVTVQRYVAVCHPYQVKRYATLRLAKFQLTAVLLFSCLFNLPRFLENGVTIIDDGNSTHPETVRLPMAESDMYQYVYLAGTYYLVIYVLPLVILVVLTYQLIRALRIAKRKREEMTSKGRINIDLTFSLVVVVAIFLVCQLFNPVRRMVESNTVSIDMFTP